MLWLKAWHIIFVVTWFAALFYLPRLFVYHAMSSDLATIERFKTMERKLFNGIMTPGAVLTLISGVWLWVGFGFKGGWLLAKIGLVGILVIYHLYCWKVMLDFRNNRNVHGHVFYRWLNELPTLILIGIVILVVVKPF
jgi:protoporphyrinogen IX oxidase